MPEPVNLISRKQFAKRLGVTVQTVYYWNKIGLVKAVKIHNWMVRIPETELDKIKSVYKVKEKGEKLEPKKMEELPKSPEDNLLRII